jgi:hypothetical protein
MREHEHVYEAILEPFTAVYGQPNRPEYLETFYREYARLLHRYSRAILEGAKDRIYRSHPPGRGQRWPSIPDIVDACEDEKASTWVRAGVAAEKVVASSWLERERKRKEDEAAWSLEAFLEANQLMQSNLGRLAASQGWILGLHDFCRRHCRLPDLVKEADVIAEMKASAKCVDDVLDGTITVAVGALRHTARLMQAKREKLRDLVLGEDEAC